MPRKKAAKQTGFPMVASSLRALGVNWLRYEQGCYLIALERSPFSSRVKPDILGLTKHRLTIEVEIKISKQDFLHDFKKKHRQNLTEPKSLLMRHVKGPSQLWYLVPRKLGETVLTHAPIYAGVLVPHETLVDGYTGFPQLEILRKATRLHTSKLGIKESIIMARDMSGTISSVLRDNVKALINRRKLEEQVEVLGGVVEKPKRKSKKTKPVEVTGKKKSKSKKDSKPAKTKSTKAKKSKKAKR